MASISAERPVVLAMSVKQRAATKEAESQSKEDSLSPPKIRRPLVEVENLGRKVRAVHGGQEGIGDLSKTKTGVDNEIRREVDEDSLVVWHPSPSGKNRKPTAPVGIPLHPASSTLSPTRRATFEEKYPHGREYHGNGPSTVSQHRRDWSDEKDDNATSSAAAGDSTRTMQRSADVKVWASCIVSWLSRTHC
jgi:hypothetical protein